MTAIAVLREWSQFALLVMTGEARRMGEWSRLKSTFFQPECIADVFWRFGNELIIGFVLRLMCLMAISALRIRMFIVWESDTEIGDEALCCREERFA